MPINLRMPAAIGRLLHAEGYRYYGLKGGRGSGKSASVAQRLLIEGMQQPHRILCCREVQNSIRESSHAELGTWVDKLGLRWFYDCGDTYIRGRNGTEFFYRGLLRNLDAVKSMSGVTRVWIEEAENVSQNSWTKLDPTIRAPGAKIYVTYNPEDADSPTAKLLDGNPSAIVGHFNFDSNPWFPASLEEQRLLCQRRDPDAYAHIWLGEPISRSDAQVLGGKWVVEDFEPGADWEGPLWGCDWGFSQDPTTLVKVWIYGGNLYIEQELYRVNLEIRHTAKAFRDVPGLTDRSLIFADCARPETISHVRGDGLNIKPCTKWQGSVEDGITHLRGAYDKIIIHPRCRHIAKEARLYKYKVDPHTDEVTDIIVDKHNHGWDAVRYALDRRIQRRGKGFFGR
ncbi:PBSX family phage terminase large subunit [Azotobacter salinestris]|uniref:PBSX family phage terminase large subunit n=1 Tax=Azotobacter salinestris TaxID=69964 RepID=UPI001266A2B0|nr:PBSX family phage terminase large subunit [Azotobacter salinestris]